jgi:hypothetical protein
MTKAIAIGFSRHSPEMPSPSDMMRVYNALEGLVRQLGAVPTYFSADDGIGRGQYKKFGGAFQKKVLGCDTVGYRSVGLAAAPAGSDAPGYESFVTASFMFGPEADRVELAFVAHEPYLSCSSAVCDEILGELARLWQWDYGFAFERDAATRPEIYLMGGGSNLQSAEDDRRGTLWYESSHDFYKDVQPPRRLVAVRDIFPYNMIGPGHLARTLPDGSSLRDFIMDDPDSALRPLADNLWLWTVEVDRTEVVREKLLGKGVIIAE